MTQDNFLKAIDEDIKRKHIVRNIAKDLERGKIYEARINGGWGQVLGRLKSYIFTYQSMGVIVEVYAVNSKWSSGKTMTVQFQFNNENENQFKRIQDSDLPLYIDWHWRTTDAFAKYLKGLKT